VELAGEDWLDAGELGLPGPDSVAVGPDDPLQDGLATTLRDECALSDDNDGSGTLDAAEREAGPLALLSGDSWEDWEPAAATSDEGSAGCSCESAAGAGPAVGGGPAAALALLLILARRGRDFLNLSTSRILG
jgi:hypothetical protein